MFERADRAAAPAAAVRVAAAALLVASRNGEAHRRAVLGAVDVLGGAENVRAPREPELMPPPTRASAVDIASTTGTASARTTAIAWTMPRARCVNFMTDSLKNPRQGEERL